METTDSLATHSYRATDSSNVIGTPIEPFIDMDNRTVDPLVTHPIERLTHRLRLVHMIRRLSQPPIEPEGGLTNSWDTFGFNQAVDALQNILRDFFLHGRKRKSFRRGTRQSGPQETERHPQENRSHTKPIWLNLINPRSARKQQSAAPRSAGHSHPPGLIV